ncbi:glycosyltransferase [Photobacterium piscicola]|uniref:glycosyltransferase n=1 Tax=Photobacterium piscicola TaxID=1378299 RepID=UPI002E1884EA|nr:glycosyltransferase [Photobacterium piscicola]
MKKNESIIRKKWPLDDKIKVSVCCITYNQDQYISEAIESFLNQSTTFPFEIIISDDFSTDNTLSIIEKYKKNYPNLIKIIAGKSNVGANNNLLRVMNSASGDYIALCEGDDFWCDYLKLEKQYKLMKDNSEVVLSYHSAYILTGNERKLDYVKDDIFHNALDVINHHYGCFSPTASYMFKRNLVDNLPCWFSDAPIGDYFIELYGMKDGKGLYIDEPMSVYRQMADNSWSSSIHGNVEKYVSMRLNMIDFYHKTKKDFPEYNFLIDDRILAVYIVIMRWLILHADFNQFNNYSEVSSYIKKYAFKNIKSKRLMIKFSMYKMFSFLSINNKLRVGKLFRKISK